MGNSPPGVRRGDLDLGDRIADNLLLRELPGRIGGVTYREPMLGIGT